MSNKPFDREVINVRERPLSSDINTIGSYAAQTLLEVLYNLTATRTSATADAASPWPPAGGAAFIGAGFKARPTLPVAMAVQLDAGLGFYNDNTTAAALGGVQGVNDQSVMKPLTLTAGESISVPAADPTNPRIDIIEVAYDRRLTDSSSRDILSPTSGGFVANAVNKTLTYNQNGRSTINGAGSINYKTGTPAASPVAPSVDAGYVKIAEIQIPALSTTIGATQVSDLRYFLQAPDINIAWTQNMHPSAVPGVTNLDAPPGVELSLVRQSTQFVVGYFKVGDPRQFGRVHTMSTINSFASTNEIAIVSDTALGSGGLGIDLVTADAALQTWLGSSAASPPMTVAVGQPLARVFWGISIGATNGFPSGPMLVRSRISPRR